MSEAAIFEPRTARALAWTGGVALAITLFFIVFSDPSAKGEASFRADAFSRSAIGYHALVRFLEDAVPVLVSHHSSAAKAGEERPLLVLEPPADPASRERLREMVAAALGRGAAVVLVLPKWRGVAMEERPGWVKHVEPLPREAPREVLRAALGNDGSESFEILRQPGGPRWWSASLLVEGDDPALSLAAPHQLLRDRGAPFEPVIASGGLLLVAKASDTRLYVVADPDLLNTSGLSRGENAVLAERLLIGHLAPKALVVDATLDGYRQAASVWRALLEPPLVTFSLHFAALAAVVLWAGGRRLGRAEEPPPRVPPGKRTLVDNTARLFGLREHWKPSLEQYFRLTVARAAARWSKAGTHPAASAGFRRQVTELARLGRRRGTGADLEDLGRAIARLPPRGTDARRVLGLARDLYRWRKEITDG